MTERDQSNDSIGGTKAAIVSMLAKEGNSSLSQREIAERLNMAVSTINEHIQNLEDKGFLERTHYSGGSHYEVTMEGLGALHLSLTEKRPNDQGLISLHNLSVKFKIQNLNSLGDKWRERWLENNERYWIQRNEANDTYFLVVKNWKFLLTRESVVIRLPGKFTGQTVSGLKNRVMDQIFSARDWLERRCDVQLSNKPVNMDIYTSTQHIAIIRDPFIEIVKQETELDPHEIRIYDEEGRLRLFGDDSDGEAHLEAGTPPSQGGFSQEDIEFLRQEFYRWIINNKEQWESLKKIAKVSLEIFRTIPTTSKD